MRRSSDGWRTGWDRRPGTAPMDIGEVHDSQSALQSQPDWRQWQVDEWDINAIGNCCCTSGAVDHFAKDCPKGKGKGKTARASTRVKARASTRDPTKAPWTEQG